MKWLLSVAVLTAILFAGTLQAATFAPTATFQEEEDERSDGVVGSDDDVAEDDEAREEKEEEPDPNLEPAFPSDLANVGLTAGDLIPQIEGKDFEGTKFKLSDYKGKVIMLDFWGDW